MFTGNGNVVQRHAIGAIVLGSLLNWGCTADEGNQAATASNRVDSVFTELGLGTCEKRVDLDDPNESTYRFCTGVSNYSLIVRRVGSGRTSIDIRTPEDATYPLELQQFVTRHMARLGDRAEWRVSLENGEKTPIALIVPVEAHENEEAPELVSSTYLAVAKITATEICVTDRLNEGSVSRAQLRSIADLASSRACLEAQPQMVID